MGVVGEDPCEGGLGIIGDDDVEHAPGAGDRRVVTALDQTGAIGLEERAIEAEQSHSQSAGAGSTLWSLVAEPDREGILRGRGRDDAIVEQMTDLGHRGVGEAVALGDVLAVERVLARAVAGTDAELESTTADLVDHRDLLGDQDRGTQRREEHRGADRAPAGAGGDGGEEGERLGQIAVVEQMVLGEPQPTSSQPVGLGRDLEVACVVVGPRTGPRLRIAEVEEETDLHDMRPTMASWPIAGSMNERKSGPARR